ncbi:MAG TPA: glycosyltransferase family 39 protein [Phaeodactylibacter sp.]|nr:glycosyltransferase family 39 protein [Phaeodactylibacter sp.]
MNSSETTYRRALYFLILALLGPALLINLGTLTLIDDEALRAWVALEMQLTDHYIVPKLHGDFYYKKPPVYNWILLGFFQLLGRMDEWAIRFPTVVFLLVYAGAIFYYVRKHFDFHFAFLAAMMFVCCGRILFYDSFVGLIDISYSLVTFLSFMVIYHTFERGQWLRLFAVSYALAAIGFLMKGLPSVVFQGATLLVYFVAQRAFRRLFTWQHVVGGLVFVLMVGGYYYAYAQHNELEKVFAVLFNESAKRTPGRYSIWFTIGHLLTYPFELLIYHFLPWGLMILYLFKRRSWSLLREHRFILFGSLTFAANILVYWAAPKVHPRYVFMLIPLAFIAFLYLHQYHREQRTWMYRFFTGFLLFCCSILPVAAFAPLFLELTQNIPYLWAKSLSLVVLLSALAWGAWRYQGQLLLTTVAVLLAVRIAFNWFAMPDREAGNFARIAKQDAYRVAEAYQDKDLRVYKDTDMQPVTSFYLTRELGRVVPREFRTFDPDAYYIIEPERYPLLPYRKVDELQLRQYKKVFDIGQLIK